MDKALIDSVLQLKPAERMKLLNVIYESLERPDATTDEVWYDEAERRLAAHKAGKTTGVPADQVLGDRPWTSSSIPSRLVSTPKQSSTTRHRR